MSTAAERMRRYRACRRLQRILIEAQRQGVDVIAVVADYLGCRAFDLRTLA